MGRSKGLGIPMLGIDPGGAQTGLCLVRADGQPVDACVIERNKEAEQSVYVGEVVAACKEYLVSQPKSLVAVEGVTTPRSHFRGQVSLINVSGLIGAAVVLGAVLAVWPDAFVVPPAGNGSGLLEAYPPMLVGPREKKGGGWMRHCRSAYDVALAARGVLAGGVVA